MPELPEVETIRRDLADCLVKQSFTAIEILTAKTIKNPAAFFKSHLLGQKIGAVSRRGKLLIISVGNQGGFLLIHLKMTGQLVYQNKKTKLAGGHSLGSEQATALSNKHTRVIFRFNNGGVLFFNDLRRFGYLKIVNQAELDRILVNNYGPEPLTKEFSVVALKKILAKRKTKLKVLLLNQKLIAGLGNIYVDESLFRARLHPERIAGSLKEAEIKKLYLAINAVIKQAIISRGTTFNNYVDSRGQKGNFSRQLQVYGRHRERCLNCGGVILKKKVAGRGTHYCPNCQK